MDMTERTIRALASLVGLNVRKAEGNGTYGSAAAERDRFAAQIARVRQLHRQVCAGRCGTMPDHCGCADGDTVCETCHEMWPCPTRRACDGTR